MWNLVEVLRFTTDLDADGPREFRRGNALRMLEAARQWKPVTMQFRGPPPSDDGSTLLDELMPEVSSQASTAAEVDESLPPQENPLVLATDAEA